MILVLKGVLGWITEQFSPKLFALGKITKQQEISSVHEH